VEDYSQKVINEYDITSKKVVQMIEEAIHTEIEYNVLKLLLKERGRNKIRFILEKMIGVKYYKNAS
jgi:hypothetical protein